MSLLKIIFLILCLLLLFASIQAQSKNPAEDSFTQKHNKLFGHNPKGVNLAIRLTDGKNKFYQGETIRLELAFSSTVKNAYSIDSATYDRSGRLEIDDFVLDKDEGVVDPMEDYFSIRLAFTGGGLRGFPTLKEKPELINYEINEWLRFDKPGKFSLYVHSGRLMKGTNLNFDGRLRLISNVIEFEIVPAEKAWAEKTLQDTIKLLKNEKNEEYRRDACLTLRFLNTEGAAREMIRLLDDEDVCNFQASFGLRSSSHRRFIVEEMEKKIDDPQFPVTETFISVLGFNAYMLTNPEPLPAYNGDDKAKAELHTQAQWKQWEKLQSFSDKYKERLTLAIPQKQRSALAVCLKTLFSSNYDKKTPNPALVNQLVNVFQDLSGDNQQNLLEYQWEQIASPAFLPLLKKIYEDPPKSTWGIQEIAIKRIYELSPEEGRQIILNELRKPNPGVGIEALGVLPDEELPEVEQLLVENLLKHDDNEEAFASFVERYATVSVLSLLRDSYEKQIGKMPCNLQESLLNYFLRVDDEFGALMLDKAIKSQNNEHTGCYSSIIEKLWVKKFTPAIEKVILAHINDSSVEVADDAILILGKRGSADVEEKLLQRFVELKREMKGREKEIKERDGEVHYDSPKKLEQSLINALAYSPSWLMNKERLANLLQFCITNDGRKNVKQLIDSWNTSITYSATGEREKFSVAQYSDMNVDELKRKLSQFPSGTVFIVESAYTKNEKAKKIFDELKDYLSERGMKLIVENNIDDK